MNKDIDPIETNEWLDSLDSLIDADGRERAKFVLQKLLSHANKYELEVDGIKVGGAAYSPYLNTPVPNNYQGDVDIERNIENINRWNAMSMVVRAGDTGYDLGGHISTYASAATLYEVGFNHFWKSNSATQDGDLIFIQGHSSPGIYARSYLEGRFDESLLDRFRQEALEKGLSSYPHPWLMSDYWQFPTVSMGLGPLQAIYQARFLKYLHNRGLKDTLARKVWCFCGDGEMDEPESLGAITVATREKLNNLIFVINCNLQRLDGPVRGNGKIIQELEKFFLGAGWEVIKVMWGAKWDPLFAQDKSGILADRLESIVDGEYQNLVTKGASYARQLIFSGNPFLENLGKTLSDADIEALMFDRGGHDIQKVYNAYSKAVKSEDKPVLILAHSIKGYGLGKAGEGLNTAHNTKKLDKEQINHYKQRLNLSVNVDSSTGLPNYFKPKADSKEINYLLTKRKALGGFLPQRRTKCDIELNIPSLDIFKSQLESSNGRELSTTMAFVRILVSLCKDKSIGKYIVPIVPDESRTFGMEGLFRQFGIYSVDGQKYSPVDADQLMFYKEAKNGQILQEGINEPGAMASWIAAATSYSVSNVPAIPFYIYYSMFGFQRVGDLCWAAGDSLSKGFLIGATSGRTTLNGEGLQHEDGHSHLLASTIPNCVTYDPTFSYELAVIIHNGLEEMYVKDRKVYYYITTMNENYAQPEMPKGAEEGIIKGMYLFDKASSNDASHKVRLLGAGTILLESIKAKEILLKEFKVDADIYSVTSVNNVASDLRETLRFNMLNPSATPKQSYVDELLGNEDAPVVIATDYIKSYNDQLRAGIKAPLITLGTDGFGRSDSREALRSFFEVDYRYIVVAALYGLFKQNKIDQKLLNSAMQKYSINQQALSRTLI